MTETFYDVLGVAPDASTADIQAAYRARLKETHPDVSDDADAGEATQRLIEARDVLTDADERARYDRLGHAAYVSGESAGAGDGSTVSEAARRAGYGGDATDDGADGDTSANAGSSADEAHERGQSRAERERRAGERVSEERRRRSAGDSTADEGDDTGDAAGDSDGDASRTDDGWTTGSTATDRTTGGDGVWNSSSTYSVRQRTPATGGQRFEMPTGRELTLFGITFALYPVLLFSALLPAFPLWVNVVIGICTVLLIGYLQSEPVIAIGVFGTWSLATAAALVVLNVGALSVLGLLALAGTWLPFGFSLLTAAALRV